MIAAEPTKNKSKSKLKIIIIIIVVLILVVGSIVGYMVVTGKQKADIINMFVSHDENTMLLDEFVLNLRSKTGTKSYLKVQMALMYTDSKQTELINTNVNKIRDIIINELREKTSQDILDTESINTIKKDILIKVNAALMEETIKDIYFVNFIIQ